MCKGLLQGIFKDCQIENCYNRLGLEGIGYGLF